MNKIYTIILLIFSSAIFGQTGMGTPTPRGALDINRPTTNTFGLVLPTNDDTAKMTNPQGGDIAEGTVMYDSKLKCIRFFRDNAWSDCLVDAPPAPQPSPLVADCSAQGFVGNYISGLPLSGTSFQVKITNNSFTTVDPISFETSDIALSGVNGIKVSAVSPASASFNPGQTRIITYTLTGTPATDETLTATFTKISLSCSKSVKVTKVIRFATFGTFSIGGSEYAAFNSQLQNPAYYGPSGTYTGKFTRFSFTNITSTLSNLSAQNLFDRYDIISIQVNSLSTADVTKIKEFVDKGGVAFLIFNTATTAATNLFRALGGTGSLTTGTSSATSTNNAINNDIFGNAINISIPGDSGNTKFEINKLPTGSMVLAGDSKDAKIFIMGKDGKAICFWDEDLISRTGTANGNVIDTSQEKFLHNIMAYALRKAVL